MSEQTNSQPVRERLKKLFEFLKAYSDLRYPPVRDIAQQPRFIWLQRALIKITGWRIMTGALCSGAAPGSLKRDGSDCDANPAR